MPVCVVALILFNRKYKQHSIFLFPWLYRIFKLLKSIKAFSLLQALHCCPSSHLVSKPTLASNLAQTGLLWSILLSSPTYALWFKFHFCVTPKIPYSLSLTALPLFGNCLFICSSSDYTVSFGKTETVSFCIRLILDKYFCKSWLDW